jgi:DNA-binding NarL/FixJ family response regulator
MNNQGNYLPQNLSETIFMDRIKVLLVDDHTIIRQGLRAILAEQNDMQVVGEGATGEEAVALAETLVPDIIVIDIAMPGISGLQASRVIHERFPQIGIIVLSMSCDEVFIDQSIQAGVQGYLVKQSAAVDLISAIHAVHRREAFFSPSVSKILLDRQKNSGSSTPELNFRENEILQLIVQGKSSKDMSSMLNISLKTVEKYRHQIRTKLGIHDLVGLTRYAISKGICK